MVPLRWTADAALSAKVREPGYAFDADRITPVPRRMNEAVAQPQLHS